MSHRRLRMAFLMDPIDGIDVRADTTWALMREAELRGHELFYLELEDLWIDGGRPAARLRPIRLDPSRRPPARLGEVRDRVLDEAVDVLFHRKDPPVDDAYVRATQILTLCRRALVLNRPQGILAANEKLYALHFADLMPETRVSRHIGDLLQFLELLDGEMIVKPLEGRGGEGIFHVHRADRNLRSILEQSTAFETRWVMAQRYLPQIRTEGDKRILLVDGEPLGAIWRVPGEGEVRANLHVGGRAVKASLDERDREIADRLSPALRRDGLFFVGIDVIGGYLTEVNVTSPTGIQEMSRLDGVVHETRVIERVEALAASELPPG